MFIDIISDLHIDQWDTSLHNLYPCGAIKNYPFKFPKSESKILIIAGDIADDLDLAIEYLDMISKTTKYEKILYTDGNHEHVYKYPELFSIDEIDKKIKKLNNNKIVYLPKHTFKIGKVVFTGCCGWWDYDNNNLNSKKQKLKYFKNWIPELTIQDNKDFIDNTIKQANIEYKKLDTELSLISKNTDTQKVVIVTHTVPDIKFVSEGKFYSSTELNTNMSNIIKKYNKLISHWIFGHTHDTFELIKDNIHFVCNPRGRPEDLNRIKYNITTIDI